LHSQSIQAVCHKYLDARHAAHQARLAGYSNRYPYKQKHYFPTKWVQDAFHFDEHGLLELSMGTWERKRQPPLKVRLHKEAMQKITPLQLKEIELVWDNGLWLAFSYNDGLACQENKNQEVAVVDFGEIHSLAAVSTAGDSLIITGRELRATKRLRNKKHKELSQKMARLKPGSRRFRKLKRAKRKISAKANARQRDLLHKASKQFVSWVEEKGIGEVVVGDVEGVQRNTSRRHKNNPQKKRRSRKVNQKISQWPFGQLWEYLSYKLAMIGVLLFKINEAYTSQTCPVCKRRKKVSGRNYRCHCGYEAHRDLHGARNILSKHLYGEIRDTGIELNPMKYLRPTQVESSRRPRTGPVGESHFRLTTVIGRANGS
jgi:putative transposase